VRRFANQALAEQVPQERAAAALAQEKSLAYGSDEPVVTGATFYVSMPDDQSIRVQIGTRGGSGPIADWPTWGSTGDAGLPPLTTKVYAEIHAAFGILAGLVDPAGTDEND